MDYFKIQDIFHQRMKEDYEKGVITNPIYKPYFQWKFYGASVKTLTKQMCHTMIKEAQRELEALDCKHPNASEGILMEPTVEDVWKQYRGYGGDCYLYSYLIGIESEITNIMMMNRD